MKIGKTKNRKDLENKEEALDLFISTGKATLTDISRYKNNMKRTGQSG